MGLNSGSSGWAHQIHKGHYKWRGRQNRERHVRKRDLKDSILLALSLGKGAMSQGIEATSRQWHPTPLLLPGKSHGRKSLVGCSPWGRWESDMTERLPFHFSLSCIGEGNGNPLQCSCLENPRDGEAWWASVYGVAQSWTRLKRLSSSSSSNAYIWNLERW